MLAQLVASGQRQFDAQRGIGNDQTLNVKK
jgi:hypothetical protein